jgi:hypothetical protein
MRITESQLRRIIRSELIKEQMSWRNFTTTMDAIKSAILAAGLTFGPGVVKDVVNHLNHQDTIGFSASKHRADIANNNPELDASLSSYEASKMTTHGPPSHHGAQRNRIKRAVSDAAEKLKKHGISPEEAQKEVDKYLSEPQMYDGDVTQDAARESWRKSKSK